MEELLFKICKRAILDREEISSIEMVLLMNELNSFTGRNVTIFELIETESLDDIKQLYNLK